MHDSPPTNSPAEWVVWNGASALLALATIGRVTLDAGGRSAWLAPPFDMVGPFNLDALEAHGRIHFAACIVMSRQRWQDDQADLRREAYARRRAAQARLHEQQARLGGRRTGHRPLDERQHRAVLNLPADGPLEPAQIRAAFRRLAQKAHPDVGGSHDQFVRITQARNALLTPEG